MEGYGGNYGPVEVLASNGTWGGLCYNSFDIHGANVICRMLGYASAVKFYGEDYNDAYTYYYSYSMEFVLDEVQCSGSESSIFDCSHNGEWITDCLFTEILTVFCQETGIVQPLESEVSL